MAIRQQLKRFEKEGKRMFVTTSFQTQSIPLLHLLVRCDVAIDVLFLETGYHFPETIRFRDEVAALLGIRVESIRNERWSGDPANLNGSGPCDLHPDHCCHVNKVEPLKGVMHRYDVWISGVRRSQTGARQALQTFATTPTGVTRFHPILDWSDREIEAYRERFRLPAHPLDQEGYQSIGCAPCTIPCGNGRSRASRWPGHDKTECGLHTTLITH